MVCNAVLRPHLPAAGLKNKGNTCFFNATLQCLLSIPGFVVYFRGGVFTAKQPVSKCLQMFLSDYSCSQVIDPQPLIKVLSKRLKIFNGMQQDAHQFLEGFLEILCEENTTKTDDCKKGDYKKDANSKSSTMASTTENSFFDLFKIVNEDRIVCEDCRYTNKVQTSMCSKYLFMHDSVQKSLAVYLTSPDSVSSDSPWTCPQCSARNSVLIHHRISSTSDYLIIHLNRFNEHLQKNYSPIIVDEEICINNTYYYNIGVVCHSGNVNGGHYYSKGLRNKKWYEFNDSHTSLTNRVFDGQTPYLLFYSRK